MAGVVSRKKIATSIAMDRPMNNPPALTKEERAIAAEKAIAARRARAEVKKSLKSGEMSFMDLIEMRDDEAMSRMKVMEMLASLPGIGETKARRLMNELRINTRRRLRGLGNQQLENLRDRLKSIDG